MRLRVNIRGKQSDLVGKERNAGECERNQQVNKGKSKACHMC